MADTPRTLAQLQTLLADNTSAAISPQDIRDFLVSVFPQTTVGDLPGIDVAGIIGRLPPTTDGFVLTLDAASTFGFKWASSGAGHTEDHDHDGSPTQKLLAANTHESPSADTHHAQSHGNGDHTSTFITQAAITTHEGLADPHSGYALDTDLSTHAAAADPHTGYVLESLLDAKGDLITASADNTPAKLTVGANDTILMADSAAGGGLKWVAPATPVAVSTASAEGTSDDFARGAHVHAHEAAHINHDTTWAARGDLIIGTANDTAAVTTLGSQYKVLQSDGTDALWKQSFVIMNLLEGLFLGGPLRAAGSTSASTQTIANHQGKVIKLPPWATAATLISFNANVATPPTGGSPDYITFDICKGTDFTTAATSIFYAASSPVWPKIAAGKNETTETGGSGGTFGDSHTVSASDRLFFYITAVGATERGRDLTAMLWAKVYLEY